MRGLRRSNSGRHREQDRWTLPPVRERHSSEHRRGPKASRGGQGVSREPVWKFWERLVASEFSDLSAPEQVYLAVNELRGSVTNGGFRSYFSTFGERASAAEAGLVKLNADGPLQVFREARRVVGSSSASALNDPAIDRQLDELDRRFYAVAEGLWDALQKFGVRQGFLPTPWPADADE